MYLTLIKLFLSFANALMQQARDKQLIDGAVAQASLESLKDVQNKIDMARDAVRNVDSVPVDSDPNNRANRR